LAQVAAHFSEQIKGSHFRSGHTNLSVRTTAISTATCFTLQEMPCSVRFGLADVIEVPSWKEETKQMHYVAQAQLHDMEGALDMETVARVSRIVFRAAVLVGCMAACAALDVVPL